MDVPVCRCVYVFTNETSERYYANQLHLGGGIFVRLRKRWFDLKIKMGLGSGGSAGGGRDYGPVVRNKSKNFELLHVLL